MGGVKTAGQGKVQRKLQASAVQQDKQQQGQQGLLKVRTKAAAGSAAGGVSSVSAPGAAGSSAGQAPAGDASEVVQLHLHLAADVAGDDRRSQLSAGRSTSSSRGWGAVPGSLAAQYSCFEEYLAARRQELQAELGPEEGVSGLIEAGHEVALGNGPEVSGVVGLGRALELATVGTASA